MKKLLIQRELNFFTYIRQLSTVYLALVNTNIPKTSARAKKPAQKNNKYVIINLTFTSIVNKFYKMFLLFEK